MTEIPDFVEEIEDKTNRNFKISNVPRKVVREFKEFCVEECGDSYAVGLTQLLKTRKQYNYLFPILTQILRELQELKQTKTERRLKTFAE